MSSVTAHLKNYIGDQNVNAKSTCLNMDSCLRSSRRNASIAEQSKKCSFEDRFNTTFRAGVEHAVKQSDSTSPGTTHLL